MNAVQNYIKYQQCKWVEFLCSDSPFARAILLLPCTDELPYRLAASLVATVAVAVVVIAVVTRCQGRHQVCEFSLGSWDLGGFSHKNYAHINA